MKIKVEQFCSLSTSPSWQAWLYRFNDNLYRSFILRLQQARGCSQNRDIMKDVLIEIDKLGGGDDLNDFLLKNYPHMIDGESLKKRPTNIKVFEHYNPKAITFPRRMIFTGGEFSLKKQINQFVIDKIKYDSIIIDGVAYVEYLTRSDENIIDRIPTSNWQIANYRLKASEND